MIRVILADDHRIVREGVRLMLNDEPDVDVVGEVDSGEALLDLMGRASADVILLDVRMPGIGGLEALQDLRQRDDRTHVIVLSMHGEPAYVRRAVELGATGYLLKSATRDELLLAVRMVAAGKAYVQGQVSAPLLDSMAPARDHPPSLSQRELQVLRLVAEGLENKQIARRLGISEATVKTHLKEVFNRMGVTNRAHAAVAGMRAGLID